MTPARVGTDAVEHGLLSEVAVQPNSFLTRLATTTAPSPSLKGEEERRKNHSAPNASGLVDLAAMYPGYQGPPIKGPHHADYLRDVARAFSELPQDMPTSKAYPVHRTLMATAAVLRINYPELGTSAEIMESLDSMCDFKKLGGFCDSYVGDLPDSYYVDKYMTDEDVMR